MSGGVASNMELRKRLLRLPNITTVVTPKKRYCVDNGVMIAWNGLLLRRNKAKPEDLDNLAYFPRWKLGDEERPVFVSSKKARD